MTTILTPRTIASTVTTSGALTSGTHTPVDATSGAVTVTLPSPPTAGAYLSVEKVDSSANTVTVSGSIRGATTTLTIAWQYESITFVWSGATWRPTEGHKTITAINTAIDGKIATQATTDAASYETQTHAAATYAGLPAGSRNGLTGWFHVDGYGALGNNSHDDTTAFQAAATAAIAAKGTLYIPQPASSYVLSSTVTLQPSSGGQFYMNMKAEGPFTSIRWTGGNSTSIFRTLGWKRSKIDNVQVRLDTTASGVVVWDIDGDATTYTSTSHLTFEGCHVTLTSSPTGITGWRFGHSADNNTDFSYITFLNCTSSAPVGSQGTHVGWRVESANALHFQWFGGGAYNLGTGFSNVQSTGANAAGVQGGPTMFFYGFGDSGCLLDFEVHSPGQYVISGGRFELGSRFVDLGASASQTAADVALTGVSISGYAPSDGIVFNVNGGSSLVLDAVEVRPPTASADFTAALITAQGPSAGRGSIIVRGGKFRAPDPFFTIASGGFAVEVSGTRYINSSLQTTAHFRRIMWSSAAAPSNDLWAIAQNGGSVGSSAFISFQGPTAVSTRGRIGFDSANARMVITDAQGGRDVALESGTTARQLVTATSGGNVHLGAKGATDGSGVKTVYLANAVTVPSVNPVGGVVLYSNNGVITWRDPSGNILQFTKPTVTGSRSSGAALANLLGQLATMGLIVDGTTT